MMALVIGYWRGDYCILFLGTTGWGYEVMKLVWDIGGGYWILFSNVIV
jgi:hypothetical protein